MRTMSAITAVLLTLSLAACGAQKTAPPAKETAAEPAKEAPATIPGHDLQEAIKNMPNDEAHKGLATSPHEGGMGGMGMGAALNTEVHLDDAVRAAWAGVVIKVTDRKTGAASTYDIPFGKPTPLGKTGLTLTADVFVPDFVMGTDGIGTRSPKPKNTAVHVTIAEKGKPDYKGWLFGSMPDIHPFPHDIYSVTLEAGIPAK